MRCLAVAVLGVLGLGCSSHQEGQERALGGVVRLRGDDKFCAGSHLRIGQEVGRIEAEVGLDFLGPVDVYLDRIDEFCADANLPVDITVGAGGCALDGQTVAADGGSLSHELVHALRFQHGIRGSPFFEEGIAAAVGNGHPSLSWSISKSDFSGRSLASSATVSWSAHELDDIRFGAHLTSWALADDVLRPQLQDFLSVDYTMDPSSELEEAFGGSFHEIESRWASSSEDSYFHSGRCDGVDIVELNRGPVEIEGSAGCDDPGTEGLRDSLLLAGRACFRLAAPALVRMSSQAELGTLLVLPVDCSGALASAPAGQSDEVVLDGCTWAVAFTTGGDQLGSFSYKIELVG